MIIMENKPQKILIVKEVDDNDKAVKEALEISKNFRILTYPESYAILVQRLGEVPIVGQGG